MILPKTRNCPLVKLYCSEQIAIPETFPNILKSFAKAAIRTQPYDLLRWSTEYFRCLSNNAQPPAKIRLEKTCRQGSLTKGYLKVLVAQVGKGFFISRCLLQERWKALCLNEDELLGYLSLCRMVNWPQLYWLHVLAVMIGSLNKTLKDTMVMVCELLTEDADGGLARMPYWMFKICYVYLAKLDCSKEQCFVNGQLVLPWGDLEEVTTMDRIPRVLSATLLRDTIVKSCMAKFDVREKQGMVCPSEPESETTSMDYMVSSSLGDPKTLFDKTEDFDKIMLLLHEAQIKPLTEDDFGGPHHICEQQVAKVHRRREKLDSKHKQQADSNEKSVKELLDKEALQMLGEVGPPWTWLHQFTDKAHNTASYNFIDQESIKSDIELEGSSSVETFDLIKEEPIEPVVTDTDTSCDKETAVLEQKLSIPSLEKLISSALKMGLCALHETSSVISLLKSDDHTILQITGEPFDPQLDLLQIIDCLEMADAKGMHFHDLDELMNYIKSSIEGNVRDFPFPSSPNTENIDPEPPMQYEVVDLTKEPGDDAGALARYLEPAKETGPKPVIPTPPPKPAEKVKDSEKPKEEITKVFENTVGIPTEQTAKMPKFCFDAKDEDELVLGLAKLEDSPDEGEPEIDMGSDMSISGQDVYVSSSGYRQDDEGINNELNEEAEAIRRKIVHPDEDYFCCLNAPSLKPEPKVAPPPYHCEVQPIPGIGPPVCQKTIDAFLEYLRVRARSQRGLINPRNFNEEKCPYMMDTHCS